MSRPENQNCAVFSDLIVSCCFLLPHSRTPGYWRWRECMSGPGSSVFVIWELSLV